MNEVDGCVKNPGFKFSFTALFFPQKTITPLGNIPNIQIFLLSRGSFRWRWPAKVPWDVAICKHGMNWLDEVKSRQVLKELWTTQRLWQVYKLWSSGRENRLKLFSTTTVDGWWKKSCTSWYGKYPVIYKVLYIPGGFLAVAASTVSVDPLNLETWKARLWLWIVSHERTAVFLSDLWSFCHNLQCFTFSRSGPEFIKDGGTFSLLQWILNIQVLVQQIPLSHLTEIVF